MGLGGGDVSGVSDSKHDVLSAMMDWVEKGAAPDQIVGTAWKNDFAPGGEPYRQRPLCMYPKAAKYSGSGDEKKPENWKCADVY
jgi:feruloyl esterase